MFYYILAEIAIAIVSALVVRSLLPRSQDQPPAMLSDFDAPTAEEGKAIPVAFGTVWSKSPNVLWYGDLRVIPIKKSTHILWKKKEQTVGYSYFMGLHMGIFTGPIDKLLAISVGDRRAWSGSVYENSRIYINNPQLFGGEEGEGGVIGNLDVQMGNASQGVNDYLQAVQGSPQPAYRGIFSVVFRRGLVSCNSPYIKPWAFKICRTLKGWDNDNAWYPEKAEITLSTGDIGANPAHIVYECIINRSWGMGYDSSQIDDSSFRAAADVFYNEGLGLCIKWTKQDTIENFLQQIMNHAGGLLTQDRRTGLFKLKPIRDDYDITKLPIFNESNITVLTSFQRPSTSSLPNEVIVQYLDVASSRNASIGVQNLANIASQGGELVNKVQYPGIPTSDLAARIAQRELNVISNPLAKVVFKANRFAYDVLPGDVIAFSWKKLGITQLALRITSVNSGNSTNGEIQIEAAEDVFGLPSSSYSKQQDTDWQDPSTEPKPAEIRQVSEASYYYLKQSLTAADLEVLPSNASYLSIVVSRPSDNSINYNVLTSSDGTNFAQSASGDFCPTATLKNDIGFIDTTIEVENIIDGDLVQGNTYAYLGDETIRIDTYDHETGAATIGRGVLDTIAAKHAKGTRIYFAQNYVDSDAVERVGGETVHVKILPITGRGQLDANLAPIDQITFKERAYRPYPPGRLRINNEPYPDTVTSNKLTIAWAYRDRTQQNLQGDETGDIGPEEGTTYSLRLVNTLTMEVLATYDNITENTHEINDLDAGTYPLKIELWSVRNQIDSMQKHELSFTYTQQVSA